MRSARIRGLGVVLFEALVLASCSNLETEKVRYLQRGNRYAAEKRDVFNPRAVAAQVELSRLTEPSNPAAGTALARSLVAAGDVARAETEIAELLKRLPHSPVVHALNGTFHASRSNAVAARSSFERALELSPGFLEALGGLTYLDLMAKAPEQAIARLEAEIARKPTSAPLLALLARVYSAASDQSKTEQALRRAVSVDPRFTPGYTMLAQLYTQQRRIDEARAEFEGVVQRDPSAVGARTMVGMLLEAQGRQDEARKSYEATVNSTENAPVAANKLAFMYAEQGMNLDVALQLATSAKQRLPDDPSVDDTIGWAYFKKDLPLLAVRPLVDSLRKRPDAAPVLYHLGMAYAKLGDKAKARGALERALKLDPTVGGSEARQALAMVSR
jgi:tetratricopeptide (TPR) repeat protein